MARVAVGDSPVLGHVVQIHQRFSERLLIGHLMIRIAELRFGFLIDHIIHVEHLVARAQIFLRVPVTIQAPIHLK